MEIVSCPKNYSGILKPVIYHITDIDNNKSLEVKILDQYDQEYGIKQMCGENEYYINVANYIKHKILIEPISTDNPTFSNMESRTASVKIQADEIYSQLSVLTAGEIQANSKTLLSNAPEMLKISPLDIDELAFIASAGNLSAFASLSDCNNNTYNDINIANTQCVDGLYAFSFSPRQIEQFADINIDNADTLYIVIKCNNKIIASRKYNIIPKQKNIIRLCWQNPFGQIDFYSFKLLEYTNKIQKSKIKTDNGYVTNGLEKYSNYSVQSDLINRKTAAWLNELIYAQNVWLNINNQFYKIDISNEDYDINFISPNYLSLNISVQNNLLNLFV